MDFRQPSIGDGQALRFSHMGLLRVLDRKSRADTVLQMGVLPRMVRQALLIAQYWYTEDWSSDIEADHYECHDVVMDCLGRVADDSIHERVVRIERLKGLIERVTGGEALSPEEEAFLRDFLTKLENLAWDKIHALQIQMEEDD